LHRIGRYEDAMRVFLEAEGKYAKLARKVIAGYICYSFNRVGEVTDTIKGIDMIMGFGFNWAPPSVLVDWMGVKGAVKMIEESGLPVPKLIQEAKPGQRFFNQPQVNVGRFFVAG